MKVSLLSKSRLGAWSAGLGIFAFIVFLFLLIFGELLNIIHFNILLVRVISTAAFILSIVAFITGVIALIKNKERSILIFVSVILGFSVMSAFAVIAIAG